MLSQITGKKICKDATIPEMLEMFFVSKKQPVAAFRPPAVKSDVPVGAKHLVMCQCGALPKPMPSGQKKLKLQSGVT